MPNAAQGAQQAAEQTSGFMNYMHENGLRLLVVAVILGLVVYAFIFLRKRFPIVREFVEFLKERKLWWMTPIVVIFMLLALLIVTMEGSAIAPFIYALF